MGIEDESDQTIDNTISLDVDTCSEKEQSSDLLIQALTTDSERLSFQSDIGRQNRLIEVLKCDTDSLPLGPLFELERLSPGALLRLFATEKDGIYTFDFGNNDAAHKAIGARHCFGPEVRKIQIDDVEYEREGFRGNFYNEDKKTGKKHYGAIITGSEVKIVSNEPEQKNLIVKKEKEYADLSENFITLHSNGDNNLVHKLDTKYSQMDEAELVKGDRKMSPREMIGRIFMVALDSEVDPYLMLSLLQAEYGDYPHHFGIKSITGIEGFEAQVQIAARTISMYMHQFTNLHSQSPWLDEEHTMYNLEFLAYFSEHYSPSEDNPRHLTNLIAGYKQFHPQSEKLSEEMPELKIDKNGNPELVLSEKQQLQIKNIKKLKHKPYEESKNRLELMTINIAGQEIIGIAEMLEAFQAANEEFVNKYDMPININSSYRSFAEQLRLYKEWEAMSPAERKAKGIFKPAKPGTSPHNFGKAIDVSQHMFDGKGNHKQIAKARRILRKHGFRQTHPKDDPVHFDYVGERHFRLLAKNSADNEESHNHQQS